jgi:catalase
MKLLNIARAIAVDEDSLQVLEETYFFKKLPKQFTDEDATNKGIVVNSNNKTLASQFVKAIGMHRFWDREKLEKVPA